MNNNKRKCECNCEFGKDHDKCENNTNKKKVKLENMYEIGEEFFINNKEHNKKESE